MPLSRAAGPMKMRPVDATPHAGRAGEHRAWRNTCPFANLPKKKSKMKLLVLFIHLLSTCLALGTIFLTDARLLGKMFGYRVVIPRPSQLDTRVITAALVALCLSGATLVFWGVQERPDYLANPKLQVKVALVALLVANAFVLHFRVFPILERGEPLAHWRPGQLNLVALSVGLSNSLWVYCAFLGIARPWNYAMMGGEVAFFGLSLWAMVAMGLRFLLALAARDEPDGDPDWMDSVKARLGGAGQGLNPMPGRDDPPPALGPGADDGVAPDDPDLPDPPGPRAAGERQGLVKVLAVCSQFGRRPAAPPPALDADAGRVCNAVATGLRGEYFAQEDWRGPLLARTDPAIDFDASLDWPAERQVQRPRSARWTGWVMPLFTGHYRFHADAVAGARVVVARQTLLGEPGAADSALLAAGRLYPIRVELPRLDGDVRRIRLEWTTPQGSRHVVPGELFYL
jgi:hypothetical protein